MFDYILIFRFFPISNPVSCNSNYWISTYVINELNLLKKTQQIYKPSVFFHVQSGAWVSHPDSSLEAWIVAAEEVHIVQAIIGTIGVANSRQKWILTGRNWLKMVKIGRNWLKLKKPISNDYFYEKGHYSLNNTLCKPYNSSCML